LRRVPRRGNANKGIAAELSLAAETRQSHMSNILSKLAARIARMLF